MVHCDHQALRRIEDFDIVDTDIVGGEFGVGGDVVAPLASIQVIEEAIESVSAIVSTRYPAVFVSATLLASLFCFDV